MSSILISIGITVLGIVAGKEIKKRKNEEEEEDEEIFNEPIDTNDTIIHEEFKIKKSINDWLK